MVKENLIDRINFDGGLLCLDFVNSVSNRKGTDFTEYLIDIYSLIDWGKKTGIISAPVAKTLYSVAKRHPRKAKAFHGDALKIRELLYQLALPISLSAPPSEPVIAQYNHYLHHYFRFLEIAPSPDGFVEAWSFEPTSFEQIIAPILKDSYKLLLSDKLIRLKECPRCGWLFYDATKNGKRKWCSMKSCGSGVKALEWYYRHKE